MSCGEAAAISHLGLLLVLLCSAAKAAVTSLPAGMTWSCVTTWAWCLERMWLSVAQYDWELTPKQLWEMQQLPGGCHTLYPASGASQCVCAPHKQHPGFPQSSHYCQVISKQPRELIFPVGPHDCGAQFVTLIAYSAGQISVLRPPFEIWVPQGRRFWPVLFFPSYPVTCGSFLQAWLFTSFSATFRPLNLPSWFISLCLFPTLLVWQK